MKPVNFYKIEEEDFHTSETIRIEFPVLEVSAEKVETFNTGLVWAYRISTLFWLGVSCLVLYNHDTVNPWAGIVVLGMAGLHVAVAALMVVVMGLGRR